MVRQMSEKEILRGQVMVQLPEGKLDQRKVSERLGIGIRQVRRLKRRDVESGIGGLVSKRRGVASNHRLGGSRGAARCCLLALIDDATGELMELQFVDTETTLSYMATLVRHIEPMRKLGERPFVAGAIDQRSRRVVPSA